MEFIILILVGYFAYATFMVANEKGKKNESNKKKFR